MATKIVVIGAIRGKFKEVFPKISALHSKNSFAFAIIAGELFADPGDAVEQDDTDVNELLNGEIDVQLPTYFSLGKTPLPQKVIDKLETSENEVCTNLYFLGKKSTIKTSEKVKIAALGGSLDPNLAVDESKDSYTPFYSVGDTESLRNATKIDILVTSEWPESVGRGSKVALPNLDEDNVSSQVCVSELCAAVRPRYHFTTSPTFFEREPFFHPPREESSDTDPGYSVTRYISLAAYGNPSKAKWIYAFTLDPAASLPQTIPAGATASPFSFLSNNKKRPLPEQGAAFSRFSAANGSSNPHHNKRQRHQRARQPPPGPGECFFCLSNPNLATHLVTAIGEESYLTTAKGPLPTAATYPALGVPAHILVIPLPHAPTLPAAPDPPATVAEMRRFRAALNSMLARKALGQLGSVAWEVSRSAGVHAHWQWLPVPVELARKGLAEAAFKVEAGGEKYPAFEVRALDEAEQEVGEADVFKVWIWHPDEDGGAEGKTTTLTLPLDPDAFRFDLQFGRRVIAKLLGLEERLNWRDCGQSEADETRDAEGFKKLFKEWDFTLA